MNLVECRDCRELKPSTRFANYTSDEGKRRCRVCVERAKDISATNRADKPLSPRRRFDGHPSRKYLEYEAFSIVARAKECEICGDKPTDKNLCIDHCHKTNKIRGALCGRCNLAIGGLDDDRDKLAAAMLYIEAYNNK